jgi:cell division septation protein DedD
MHARDPADLYKDKIEVSLDGRQIFYLFFGGAVIVGLVFVLGVMVGRRVEARGHVDPARTAAAADPLAALDRLEGSGGLSFKGALTGAPAPTEVERAIGELERARAGKPTPAPAPKAEKPKIADKAERAEPEEGKEGKEGKEAKDSKDSKDGKKKKKKPDGESADAGSTRFTLQLSSFQDREEADAFLAMLKEAGFQAYVVEADVGGKGTFYRVRIGSYRSMEAANDARAELERVTKKNASVMRL